MTVKRVLISLIGIAITGTSVALIGAAAAPYIMPKIFDWPAFLGLMYPFLLLLHLGLFVALIVISQKKTSFIFLIPALITINIFLNSFGLNYFDYTAAGSGSAVKLMTYNVHMFEQANNLDESVEGPMLALIKNEQPAILCVQDFTSDPNTIDSIKTLLSASQFYNGPNDLKVFPTKSIGTFSRFPIVNSGFIILSETSPVNEAIFTDINTNGKILRVYNVHFESLGFPPSAYEEWRNANLIGKFEFLFKVKSKFSLAFKNRSEQVKILKKHTLHCPYPFIIAGDFNDTPSSFAVGYTMRGMKNAFREKGRGYTVTFNGGLPDFQIDYVMVNPLLKILNYNVVHKQLSDHYPVVVDIGFK